MSWNHRVIRHVNDGEVWFAIHEAYYNKQGGIWSITTEPIAPVGESRAELKRTIELMLDAVKNPVLEYDMEFAKPPFKISKRMEKVKEVM